MYPLTTIQVCDRYISLLQLTRGDKAEHFWEHQFDCQTKQLYFAVPLWKRLYILRDSRRWQSMLFNDTLETVGDYLGSQIKSVIIFLFWLPW